MENVCFKRSLLCHLFWAICSLCSVSVVYHCSGRCQYPSQPRAFYCMVLFHQADSVRRATRVYALQQNINRSLYWLSDRKLKLSQQVNVPCLLLLLFFHVFHFYSRYLNMRVWYVLCQAVCHFRTGFFFASFCKLPRHVPRLFHTNGGILFVFCVVDSTLLSRNLLGIIITM